VTGPWSADGQTGVGIPDPHHVVLAAGNDVMSIGAIGNGGNGSGVTDKRMPHELAVVGVQIRSVLS
jgi:hypothetical protein